MIKAFTLFAAIFFFSSQCFSQSWLWGTEGSVPANHANYDYDEGYSVITDANGDAYVTGSFVDTLMLDTVTLRNTADYPEAYIVKYDGTGKVLWAKQSKAASNDYEVYSSGTSLRADSVGDVYMTGGFTDSVLFGSIKLRMSYHATMFLVKYDKNGNVVWAEQAKPTYKYGQCFGRGVTTDATGNIYVTGEYSDTVSFGSFVLTSHLTNFFIAKYDPNGNLIWAKQLKDIAHLGFPRPYAITIDKLNNFYVTGSFQDSLIIGSTALYDKSLKNPTVFIAKYDSGGNSIWAKQAMASVPNNFSGGFVYPSSVAVDENDNIYVSGTFSDSLIFDTAKLGTLYYHQDAFLVKYDSSGKIEWAKASTSYTPELYNLWVGSSVAADKDSHVYLSCSNTSDTSLGWYIVFGNDTISTIVKSYDGPSILVEFDGNGNVLCSSALAGGGDDKNSIAVDAKGKHIFLGGDLYTSLKIGPDSLPFYNAEVPFIARWLPCTDPAGGVIRVTNSFILNLYPNPNDGTFILDISSENKTRIELYNIIAEKVFTSNLINGENQISLKNPVQGIYIYKITDERGNTLNSGKVVIE